MAPTEELPTVRRAFCLLLLVAGGVSAEEPKSRSWDVGGVKREALVVAPKETKSPPLLFVFHGHGGTAKAAATRYAFHEHWPEEEGKRTGWQHGIGDQKDRDLSIFDAMLASLKKDYAIDEKRRRRNSPNGRRGEGLA